MKRRRSLPVFILFLTANNLLCQCTALLSVWTQLRPACQGDARRIASRFCRTNSARPTNEQHGSVLAAAGGGESSSSDKQKILGRKEGVYVRPSAAIERGSGFFVPGLEGPKVRLAGGLVLLTLTALNHVLSSSFSSTGNTFQEALATVFSILVLIQASIEYTKEARRNSGIVLEGSSVSSDPAAVVSVKSYQQRWFVPMNDNSWKERVEWAAQTYLTLTAATHISLIGPGGSSLYWLGVMPPPDTDTSDAAATAGGQAALTACFQSTSGRVALPPTHITVTSLAPPDHSRCVVLQRVDETNQLCWMVTSDQLLASFTKRDLQWLGQLALYIQMPLLE